MQQPYLPFPCCFTTGVYGKTSRHLYTEVSVKNMTKQVENVFGTSRDERTRPTVGKNVSTMLIRLVAMVYFMKYSNLLFNVFLWILTIFFFFFSFFWLMVFQVNNNRRIILNSGVWYLLHCGYEIPLFQQHVKNNQYEGAIKGRCKTMHIAIYCKTSVMKEMLGNA